MNIYVWDSLDTYWKNFAFMQYVCVGESEKSDCILFGRNAIERDFKLYAITWEKRRFEHDGLNWLNRSYQSVAEIKVK